MATPELTFEGSPIHLRGDTIEVGELCPEFRVIERFPHTTTFDRDQQRGQIHLVC